MLKSVYRYINNDIFSINIWKNYIEVNNFSNILLLEEDKVIIENKKQTIVIKGHNICIRKLLDNEILLSGDIKSVELGETNV